MNILGFTHARYPLTNFIVLNFLVSSLYERSRKISKFQIKKAVNGRPRRKVHAVEQEVEEASLDLFNILAINLKDLDGKGTVTVSVNWRTMEILEKATWCEEDSSLKR
ncbi:unnamed protein product [Timema podura]|uniref:Uncharacterized protein n=1 Tax=Timema podura TaxID=61482 RepID=A0ABN7NWA7_TIMPD|nr:unnamed protein product [Timema podura]